MAEEIIENNNQETTEDLTTSDKIQDLVNEYEELMKSTRSFLSKLKAIKKEVTKLEKKRIRKTRDPNRAKKTANGFALPVKISDNLASFLNIEPGTLISRTDVLKKIDGYVKEHQLQNPKDRRIIDLDRDGGNTLRELLEVPTDQTLSYFTLQTYLKQHFIKNVSTPKNDTNKGLEEPPQATPEKKTETMAKKKIVRTRKRQDEVSA